MSAPWQRPGAKGKPNGHRHPEPRPTPTEARLLATLRTELHNALSYKGNEQNAKYNTQYQFQLPAAKEWSHRKAEWICSACNTNNFVSRLDCRKCQTAYTSTMTLVPAGSAPVGRKGLLLPVTPARGTQRPALPASPTSVEAAEAALRAAQEANAPTEMISTWQEEVKRRQATAQAKSPPTVRARLAGATAEANTAMQAREKAQKRLQAAKKELEEAQMQLETAVAEETKAAAALRLVTSEVAPKPEEQSPEAALSKLLTAVKANQQGDTNAPELLTAAAQAAEQLLNPPVESTQEGSEATAAAATAAVAAAAAAPKSTATAPSVRSREEPLPTQEGDMDLDDSALDDLLSALPPSKRQRAMARLEQLGVQEQADKGAAA